MTQQPHRSAVRQFAEFTAGLLLVVLCGWGLLLAGWSLAHRAGVSVVLTMALAAALSLGLFLLLERNHWLSHRLGLRVKPGASSLVSSLLFWLLGLAWLFVKTSIIDPDRPEQAEEGGKKTPPPPRDPARETVETIVFVVVLVLLLKLFVTEAFVIPTGSMAETLLGYNKYITCEKCGHRFPVNSHDEEEPNNQDGQFHKLVGYCCPNCRFRGETAKLEAAEQKNITGDRVLVLKPAFEIGRVRRGDVVVFKFPERPQDKFTAANYIKRAMGFGGETLGIYRGELFATTALDYPATAVDPQGNPLYPRPKDPNDLWRGDRTKDENGRPFKDGDRYRGQDYRYVNNAQAVERFELSRRNGFTGQIAGEFEIVRKEDDHMLACRRMVWDNDKQPKDLAGKIPTRWHDPLAQPGKPFVRWATDNDQMPKAFSHAAGDLDWVRYRHLVRAEAIVFFQGRWPVRVDDQGNPIPFETDDQGLPKLDARGNPLYAPVKDENGRDRRDATGEVVRVKPARDPKTGLELVATQMGTWEWDQLSVRPLPPEYKFANWKWETPVSPPLPRPVDNFLGYNAGADAGPGDRFGRPRMTPGEDRWVGDLTLECEAKLAAGGEVVLELSKGACRFRAAFADGRVTLFRLTRPTREAPEKVEEVASRPCRVTAPGTYRLRFANVDSRLRVWVDDRAVDFGADGDYAPGLTAPDGDSDTREFGGGWTEWNDVEAPAGIGAKGTVDVQHVTLHRDIFYTNQTTGPVDLYYVHPGHYFCLGDNSASSADSRTWGLVPERLMLGRAVFVFWPAFPKNRVGFIK